MARQGFVRVPALVLAGLVVLAAWQGRAEEVVPSREGAAERMKHDIFFLASDECEGRGVATQGINKAADFIAAEFKKAGLKPGGPDGSYFQPFTMNGQTKLASPNSLVLHGPQGQEIELKQGEHFSVAGLSGSGKVSAPVVFAGYGVTAAEAKYDDFQGLDVAGKVVVLLRKTPRPDSVHAPFAGSSNSAHAALIAKMTNAESHQAAAVLIVNDRDTARSTDVLMDFGFFAMGGGAAKVPVLHIRRAMADRLFQSGLGTTLASLEADIDRDLKPRGAALTGWTATAETTVDRPKLNVKNVVGVVEGSGKLADETVVVGAHYDHLGYGGMGSLARGSKAIHHGADDNGSGTTSVIELARRFGKPAEGGDRRRLVFMTFSGEEMGLLGSDYYVKNPLFPIDRTVAMVNLDMVGRLGKDAASGQDKLLVEGAGSAKHFNTLLDELNEKYDFKMTRKASGFGPSDHASFYGKKVPVLFYWTGTHPDYHRPSDTADKINIAGMCKIANLAEDTINHLAKASGRPEYVQVASSGGRGAGSGVQGPRLGIMPGYAEGDDKEGVLVERVNDGGPGAKAGLKSGDRIVEIAGKPVRNVEAYMAVLATQKRGEAVEIGVLRNGKKITLKATPE